MRAIESVPRDSDKSSEKTASSTLRIAAYLCDEKTGEPLSAINSNAIIAMSGRMKKMLSCPQTSFQVF